VGSPISHNKYVKYVIYYFRIHSASEKPEDLVTEKEESACEIHVDVGLLSCNAVYGGIMFLRKVGRPIYLQVHMAYNPEDQHRHFHRRENLKSHI
jgi:hypothetical protein